MRCRPHYICTLIALIGLLVVPGVLTAKTLTVDGDGKTGYETIQAAVDAAADGDVIVINPGTYTGRGNRDIDLLGKSITLQSTNPGDTSVVQATIIDCAGTTDDPRRGFWVHDCTSEISGLTITNGLAAAGGAVYCEGSILTLLNCRILDNATLASGPGGGVYCYNAAVSVAGCLIEGNSTGAGADRRFGTAGSGGDGGGIYSANSVVYISDSSVSDNTTGAGGDSNIQAGNGGDGGGICADALVVIDSTISGNVCGNGGEGPTGGTGGSGGGICSARSSIERSVIEANIAGSAGDSSSGKGAGVQDAVGGGIYCSDSIEIFSSLIAGNRSANGSGLWCAQGLINLCTIVGNSGAQTTVDGGKGDEAVGAGVSCSTKTIVTNSILWDNNPVPIQGHDCDNILYCNIQDGLCQDGLGNISEDPGFIEAGYWDGTVWVGGDHHLASDSPCVDAGDPAYDADSEETDLDGRGRRAGIAVDMGAYEQTDLVPVYRFWSPKTSKHFYTIKEAEKDKLITQYPEAWTYEGPVYYVYKRASASGLVPVYRLWSSKVASHFYTVSESERASLLDDKSGQGWTDEGVVFYAYSEQSAAEGRKPVYRFWSDSLASHFYTIKETEKDKLIAQYSDAWTYEGIVWYAFDELGAANGGSDTPSTDDSNVYEFSNATGAASFSLELTAKVDGKPVQIDSPSLMFPSTTGSMEMIVDLDAMTTELNSLGVETGVLGHAAVAGDRASGQGEYSFNLAISGSFHTTAHKGPYGIESRSLSFPTTAGVEVVDGDEMFTIVGSATIDGVKSDINLALNPTNFDLDGIATFLEADASDLLDLSMDGPFKWTRGQHEDLLFERSFKGRLLQVYISGIRLRTTGLWGGKQNPSDEKGQK